MTMSLVRSVVGGPMPVASRYRRRKGFISKGNENKTLRGSNGLESSSWSCVTHAGMGLVGTPVEGIFRLPSTACVKGKWDGKEMLGQCETFAPIGSVPRIKKFGEVSIWPSGLWNRPLIVSALCKCRRHVWCREKREIILNRPHSKYYGRLWMVVYRARGPCALQQD